MSEQEKNTIRQLTRIQRRVLGTLVEKGFTTPEQYPLTLKSTATGCNQKSNRDPTSDFSEGDVADALEELREMGLVAEVYSDGGRAARYKHYIRHRFDFSEPQIAIMTELMLRGRQQPGELRTRASRMVRIDSQDQLKSELQALEAVGYIQASGPLERRGVEVDHTLYLDGERRRMDPVSAETQSASPQPPRQSSTAPAPTTATSVAATAGAATIGHGTSEIQSLTGQISELHQQVNQQKDLVQTLSELVQSLQDRLDRIERDLGI